MSSRNHHWPAVILRAKYGSNTHAAWSAWGSHAIASAIARLKMCAPRALRACMLMHVRGRPAGRWLRRPRISQPVDWRALAAPVAARTRACARPPIDRGPAASSRSLTAAAPSDEPSAARRAALIVAASLIGRQSLFLGPIQHATQNHFNFTYTLGN